ncbi:MAG: hypothetical protein WBX16_24010, partial [Candidatus Acidiferrales bacterium]
SMSHADSSFYRVNVPVIRNTQEAREANALILLTQFHDLAERVRRCDECGGNWFVAATAWQTYCSVACRQKHASRSLDFKAKRAKYMEGYRAGVKERKRRAKERYIQELKQKHATAMQKIVALKGKQPYVGL